MQGGAGLRIHEAAAEHEPAFVHRKLADGDIYWVSNRNNAQRECGSDVPRARARRRNSGTPRPARSNRRPTGSRTAAPPYRCTWSRTTPCSWSSARPPRRRRAAVPKPVETTLATVEGPWDVAFQPDRGAPAEGHARRACVPGSENSDAGVKYFSGTGTYTKTIQAPADWFKTGAQAVARPGRREEPRRGHGQRQAARHPLEGAVPRGRDRRAEAGRNTLEIKVTNLWVNRLIGDQQPDAPRKYTYTTSRFYRADSPLLPSGLIGPVQIVRSE